MAETLYGHDEAWREWRAALSSPRMHHGWIVAGPRGLGKGAFVRAAALEAIGAQPSSNPFHPDVLVLEHLPSNDDEEKKRAEGKPFTLKRNITIDQIRQMQQRLTMRPSAGDRRVVIIDPVDDLEKSAVNALLKSLEEPPDGTLFLLVAHRPGRLLATVRSRCRIMRISPLPGEAMEGLLAERTPEADMATRKSAIAAAAGSPGVALDFVEQKMGTIRDLMVRIAREGDDDFALRGALAGEIGARPTRERQAAALELARATLAGDLRTAPRARQLAIIEAHGQLTRLMAQAPTYNFDPGLLVMEIGGLLASAAMPRAAS